MLGSCASFLLDQSPDEERWLASSLQPCASLPLCADLFEHLWCFDSAIMSQSLWSPQHIIPDIVQSLEDTVAASFTPCTGRMHV